MKFYLEKLSSEDEAEFISFYNEFMEAGGRIYPGILGKYNGDFLQYLAHIEKSADEDALPASFVASDTYVMKGEGGRIYGMSSLRHKLTEGLLIGGGHIGYGIRPSERGRGCGTKQLALLLEKCKLLDINRVLITCDKDNVGSAKVAINNGATLEDEILENDRNILQRYWITLT